jgi:DNA-3-methyladenine glycosylase I
MPKKPIRCSWAVGEPLCTYHDEEWGVPQHQDRTLFEFLTLEGAQAGLSWVSVLKRRADYRRLFINFDAKRVARLTARDQARLMQDPSIIRNRLKIASTVSNAGVFLETREAFGSFDAYLWSFVDGKPLQGSGRGHKTRSEDSDALSKDLRKRGFSFVGTTICYAFMQAVGMINDHAEGCFRRRALSRAR